jgi:hypothetical protein
MSPEKNLPNKAARGSDANRDYPTTTRRFKRADRLPRGGAGLPSLVPTSTEENHPLDSTAPLATVLNYIDTLGVGGAFLNLHGLFANDAD